MDCSSRGHPNPDSAKLPDLAAAGFLKHRQTDIAQHLDVVGGQQTRACKPSAGSKSFMKLLKRLATDGLVQLDLDFEWRSNVIWTLGADLAYGGNNGLFGQFAGTDRIRLGLEIGF